MALSKRVSGAQVCHKVARGQLVADVGTGKNIAIVADGDCARFQTFRGKRDVGGDNNVAVRDPFGNPHVGDIRTVRDDNRFHQRMGVRPDPPIGNYENGQGVPVRNFQCFGPYGAGVSVDIDLGQKIRPSMASA